MLKAWGVKGRDGSRSKGLAAHSPLQQRLWLKGMKSTHTPADSQCFLQGSWVWWHWGSLCQWAKAEPFNHGLPQGVLPWAGQHNITCYLKLAACVWPFYLPCPPLALCFSRDTLLILKQEPHLKHAPVTVLPVVLFFFNIRKGKLLFWMTVA